MFTTSIIGSIMNMKCDIYTQKNSQSSSGAITREWVYHSTVPCKIQAMPSGGPFKGDDKQYDQPLGAPANPYNEILEIKMISPVKLSKRWRVTEIKTNTGQSVFQEVDRYGSPATIFEVKASHAMIDPMGNVSYYHSNLTRVPVQYNDNTSV